jgi:hypothetical protein
MAGWFKETNLKKTRFPKPKLASVFLLFPAKRAGSGRDKLT